MLDIDFIKGNVQLPGNIPPNPLSNAGIRDTQGVGNNLFNPTWGAADQLFARVTPAQYSNAQGTFTMGPQGQLNTTMTPTSYSVRGINLVDAEPRIISNLVSDQSGVSKLDAQDNPSNPNGARVSPLTGTVNPLPYSGFTTLFGQFFDHGLDFVKKGADGTVLIPLLPGDPLYVEGSSFNFMMASRTNTVAGESTNTVSPFIDLSQSYGSSASHTVFLREYSITGSVTGRLVSGRGDAAGTLSGIQDGMATWFDIKANAANIGITLHDININNIPMVRMNADGTTFFDVNGKAFLVGQDAAGVTYYFQNSHIGTAQTFYQLNEETGAVIVVDGANGTPSVPTLLTTLKLNTVGHAFLDDMAHGTGPNAGNTTVQGDIKPDLTMTELFQNGDVRYSGTIADLVNQHFIAGDGRTNENLGLTAIHDVFHSEHNRVLIDIKAMVLGGTDSKGVVFAARPDAAQWTNENFFQAAKLVTEMEYQHLVFGEFVRKLSPNINGFAGYDVAIDPAITAEFAHAVYRFGHSMLTDTIDMTGFNPATGTSTGVDKSMQLFDAFLNPTAYTGNTAGEIALGMSKQVGNAIDEWVTDSLRNTLVGLPLDLAALNIVRGRDSGVPSLNQTRASLWAQGGGSTLKPYESWDDFGMNLLHPESLKNFIMAYSRDQVLGQFGTGHTLGEWTDLQNSVAGAAEYALGLSTAADSAMKDVTFMLGGDTGYDRVDLWLGGLAEQKVSGGMLGSTFDFIFAKQMIELQAGDRFYYLDRLAGTNLLAEIEGQLFSDIVMRNTGTQHLYSDIFSVADKYVEMSAQNPTYVTASAMSIGAAAGYYNGTFYGNTGNYTDARGVLNPNGKGNASEMIGGTENADKINAMGGNDTVWGDGGNDTIEGGNGNDFLHGGDGNDTLTDTQGDDLIWGEAGDDLINGGVGADVLDGGAGNDLLFGGAGADLMDGGEEDDVMYGDAGQIVNNVLDPNGNDDIMTGGSGNDHIYGGGGADAIDGGEGDDTIEGGSGADGMVGWDGNDTFVMDEGDIGFNNTMDGGLGFDVVDYSASRGYGLSANGRQLGIDVNLNNLGPAVIPAGINVPDAFLSIESVIGSAFDDVIIGGGAVVTDQAGVAVIRLDAVTGLPVPLLDPVTLQPVIDALTGLPVFQNIPVDLTLDGGAGNDILAGGLGTDLLIGGAGSDIVSYAAAASAVTINLGLTTAQVTGGMGTDRLVGVEGVLGSAFADTLTGDGNNNVIDGGSGNINDVLVGGAGVDTVSYNSAGAGVTFTLVSQIAQTTVGAGSDTVSGFENVVGSAFNDTLTGDGNANVMEGGLGDDIINGGAGTDTVSYASAASRVVVNLTTTTIQNTLGAGSDTLTAMENLTGSGFADTLTGNTGNNVIDGGAGADIIAGGAGNDTITGGAGNDAIDGGAGTDVAVFSGNRTDYVITGARTGTKTSLIITGRSGGTDTLTGVEQLQFADGLVTVPTILTTGNDTYNGTANADLAMGLAGNDTMNGAAGSDALDGGDGNDTLNGDAGDDQLTGAAGTDTLNGGAGVDTALFSGARFNYTVTTNEATGVTTVVDLRAGGDGTDTLTLVEQIRFADELLVLPTYLTANADTYTGTAGDDTVYGLAGNDTLSGGAGTDTLLGGADNDSIDGGAGGDVMNGGLGDDTFVVDSLADIVQEAVGEGTDVVRSSISLALAANVENLVLTGTAAIDGVGNSGNNTLTGNTGANRLTGGAGSDTLDGGADADVAVFSGNSSNYTVSVNAALGNVVVTALTGTDGTDTLTGIEQLEFADGVMLIPVLLTAGNDTYTGTVDADVVYGLAGNDTLSGGAGSDQLYGGDGTDSLVGGDGDDQLNGGAGNDVLTGGAGNDTASYAEVTTAVTVNLATTAQQNTGGGGRDTLTTIENVVGGSANDTLTGDANANRLEGGAGADLLTGGAGNDTLVGGVGIDTLNGGAGLDTFLFNVDPTAANRDTVQAFTTADDTFQLDHSVFAALTAIGALDAGAFNTGTAATQADDRIIYNAANGALYYDADGLGGVAAIQFATLTGLVGTLTSNDFVIV